MKLTYVQIDSGTRFFLVLNLPPFNMSQNASASSPIARGVLIITSTRIVKPCKVVPACQRLIVFLQ